MTPVICEDDHGNLPTTSTAVEAPSSTKGIVEVEEDADVFSFFASAGTRYNFATGNVNVRLAVGASLGFVGIVTTWFSD